MEEILKIRVNWGIKSDDSAFIERKTTTWKSPYFTKKVPEKSLKES